jgi:hypothetical protein
MAFTSSRSNLLVETVNLQSGEPSEIGESTEPADTDSPTPEPTESPETPGSPANYLDLF